MSQISVLLPTVRPTKHPHIKTVDQLTDFCTAYTASNEMTTVNGE